MKLSIALIKPMFAIALDKISCSSFFTIANYDILIIEDAISG